MTKLLISVVSLCGLVGCGGTSVPLPGGGPLSPTTVGTGTPGVAVIQTGTNLNVTANSMTQTLPQAPILNQGTFVGYQNIGYDSGALVSASANSAAAVAYVQPAVNQISAVNYARTAQSVLPTTGTATAAGDYSGMLFSSTGNFLQRVTGDVSMNVDFGAATVDGNITNREMKSLFNNTPFGFGVTNVALGTAPIGAGGTFSGTATGGQAALINWAAASGTYEGLIAGSSGGEIVGATQINQEISGTPYIERGAIAVGH